MMEQMFMVILFGLSLSYHGGTKSSLLLMVG